MNELNKELMFENIYYLLSETDKKIGEFETEVGVSPGYISRTTKDEKSKPGIDFVINAAHVLGVGVDTLISVRLSELTPTEKYLLQFLSKLKKDTADDKLTWNRESANELNQLEPDYNGNIYHALFDLETFIVEGEMGEQEETSRVVMNSNTFGKETFIEGDCFNLSMKNDATLYLMNISKNPRKISDVEGLVKEVWIRIPGSMPKFLCSSSKNSSFKSVVEDLYLVVSEFSKHPKIEKHIRYVIDAFMEHDDLTTDEYAAFDL